MKSLISDCLLRRYKQLRDVRLLSECHTADFALVGLGQHSLTTLLPVLHSCQIRLKYLCMTAPWKARLAARRFPSSTSTTQLQDVLTDESVRGVFVCGSPHAHFRLAKQVLESGKSLFIEKPPCQSLAQLDELIALQRREGAVCVVGLQRRFAPAVRLLRQRLRREKKLLHYDLKFLTGAYPEGDVLSELFIHPLDLVTHLFGAADVLAFRRVERSFLIMLQHRNIVGTLLLSEMHSWTDVTERLTVSCGSGDYELSASDELVFTPRPHNFLGLPMEKLRGRKKTSEWLYERNHVLPVLAQNSLVALGYYDELLSFVRMVDGGTRQTDSDLASLRKTYVLMEKLRGLF